MSGATDRGSGVRPISVSRLSSRLRSLRPWRRLPLPLVDRVLARALERVLAKALVRRFTVTESGRGDLVLIPRRPTFRPEDDGPLPDAVVKPILRGLDEYDSGDLYSWSDVFPAAG